jgi:hypothetical protein
MLATELPIAAINSSDVIRAFFQAQNVDSTGHRVESSTTSRGIHHDNPMLTSKS